MWWWTQQKLDVARRALGVATETEAIDQALDLVAFREELAVASRSHLEPRESSCFARPALCR
jgi:hypothetical protein